MIMKQPELNTARLQLRLGTTDDIPAILHYYLVNLAYLAPFEPQRPASFYTRDFWKTVLAARESDFYADQGVKLLIFLRAEPDQVIGTINLNTIVRGAFQAATLGYGLSAQHQGQGATAQLQLIAGAQHRLEQQLAVCQGGGGRGHRR